MWANWGMRRDTPSKKSPKTSWRCSTAKAQQKPVSVSRFYQLLTDGLMSRVSHLLMFYITCAGGGGSLSGSKLLFEMTSVSFHPLFMFKDDDQVSESTLMFWYVSPHLVTGFYSPPFISLLKNPRLSHERDAQELYPAGMFVKNGSCAGWWLSFSLWPFQLLSSSYLFLFRYVSCVFPFFSDLLKRTSFSSPPEGGCIAPTSLHPISMLIALICSQPLYLSYKWPY